MEDFEPVTENACRQRGRIWQIETAGSEHIGQLRAVSNHRLTKGVMLITLDLYRLLSGLTRYDDPLLVAKLVSDACRSDRRSRQLQVIGYFRRGLIDRADHLTRYVPAVQGCPSVPKHLPIGGRMFG